MPCKLAPPAMRWVTVAFSDVLSTDDIEAWLIDCCADMSMCWPSPERVCRSHSAMSAAPAASDAALCMAWGSVPPARSGARSLSPVTAMFTAEACSTRSDTAQPAFGPSLPNGVMETWMSAGLSAASTSRPSPSASASPGSKDSNTTSAPAMSAFARATPSAVPKSSTTLRLPRLYAQWCSDRSGCSTSPAKGASRRADEPPGGSTAITSAPICAQIAPARCPRSSVRSMTR